MPLRRDGVAPPSLIRPGACYSSCIDAAGAAHSQEDTVFTVQAPAAQATSPTPSVESAPDADPVGALINLAGRQRMLSQRIVLYTVLAALGDGAARGAAAEALALFRHSHARLVNGEDGLPARGHPVLQSAFFGAHGADAPVRAFAERAHAVLDELAQSATLGVSGRRRLDDLVAQATPMLACLNELTQAYEAVALERTRAAQARLAGLVGRIGDMAHEARIVSLNARVAASRAGPAGQEFGVVAQALADVSEKMADLALQTVAREAPPA